MKKLAISIHIDDILLNNPSTNNLEIEELLMEKLENLYKELCLDLDMESKDIEDSIIIDEVEIEDYD